MRAMRRAALALALVLSLPADARSHRRNGRTGEAACASTCGQPPLFDSARPLRSVDAEVLKLCPVPPASRVEPDDVRAFFAAHLADQRLVQAVSAVAPFAKDKTARAAFLASIWSGPARRNAFTHVLCGDDWDTDKLGGLHLEARYLQLEAEGKICYDGPARSGPACNGRQCVIRYRGVAGFSCGRKQTGGFAQGLDAIDLLSAGTRGYGACCMGGAPATPGAQLRDGGRYAGPRGITFQIWCGERNGAPGIASFYPTEGAPNCQ